MIRIVGDELFIFTANGFGNSTRFPKRILGQLSLDKGISISSCLLGKLEPADLKLSGSGIDQTIYETKALNILAYALEFVMRWEPCAVYHF